MSGKFIKLCKQNNICTFIEHVFRLIFLYEWNVEISFLGKTKNDCRNYVYCKIISTFFVDI